ncbi:MAG: hypothetical protein HXY25_07385 [Alphaproteobacteria bacterium]|nr:hypothetical protein [Alphaproteobacteria bacterium]
MVPTSGCRRRGSFVRVAAAAGLALTLSSGAAFAINATLEDNPSVSGFQQLNEFISGLTTHSETLNIVAHNGKLFASLGRWQQSDTCPDNGAQIIVKNSATAQWQLFATFPYTVRVTGLASFTVPSSANGGEAASTCSSRSRTISSTASRSSRSSG